MNVGVPHMHQMLAKPVAQGLTRLSHVKPGDRGVIIEVRAEGSHDHGGVDVQELERRLLEFGFVEGAEIEVLHQGLIGQDPIAVRVDDMRVALRRRDAADVWVRLETQ